jgi:DNA-3-methyladenine glycosylase II
LAQSSFSVDVKPPFRLELTVWALRRRSINQMDCWDGSTYRRVIDAGHGPVEVAVTQVGSAEAPRLHVGVTGAMSGGAPRRVRQTLDRVLGLDVDLLPFYKVAAAEPRLNDLAIRFRGMRPPRFPTIFEALANGIACQQLSLEAGLTLLNRLAAAHGQVVPRLPNTGRTFPQPHDLAGVSLESLRALGFSRSKCTAIIGIASAVQRDDMDLDGLDRLDDDALQARLDELRGVGRWTAEYVLLRGYGRLDVFPGDDIGARNGLQRWLGLRRPLDYKRTKAILRQWHPYCGLVYLHLLLRYLGSAAK